MRHLSPSLTHGYGRAGPTKSTLSASDDAWRCQAPASCQSLDQQACATARSRSSRCMALSYLLLLVPKCVPWPTPVHTHRAAVGAARALLQVFRSLAAVCKQDLNVPRERNDAGDGGNEQPHTIEDVTYNHHPQLSPASTSCDHYQPPTTSRTCRLRYTTTTHNTTSHDSALLQKTYAATNARYCKHMQPIE